MEARVRFLRASSVASVYLRDSFQHCLFSSYDCGEFFASMHSCSLSLLYCPSMPLNVDCFSAILLLFLPWCGVWVSAGTSLRTHQQLEALKLEKTHFFSVSRPHPFPAARRNFRSSTRHFSVPPHHFPAYTTCLRPHRLADCPAAAARPRCGVSTGPRRSPGASRAGCEKSGAI